VSRETPRPISVLAVALALALVLVGGAGPVGAARGQVVTVGRVVDGDTLRLNGGERVRLIGIDTPEIAHFGTPTACFGRRAAAFTERLLPPGERVRLVRDVEVRDQYDRLLAYVYRARDGLFVNAELVRRGYAYVDTVPPNVRHVELFRRLARRARAKKRGLWGECDSNDGIRTLVGDGNGGSKAECLPEYQGACVPPPPPDLDCSDIGGPVRVVGDDPHHLDGDHDGKACEPIEE
jgi:endonuclease YncB( thermonuclease family)